MIRTALLALSCIALTACLGDKTRVFDSPLDPASTTYANHPVKSLAETGGLVADFETGQPISNIGKGISGFGPDASKAQGTVSVTNIGAYGSTPTESPAGVMRTSTTYGTGLLNFGGANLDLRNGLGQPISLRAFRGLSFLVRGDAGPLDIKLENSLVTDYNFPSIKLNQIPVGLWERIYIDFSSTAWQCHLKTGCPTLAQALDSITSISFQYAGFTGTTRIVDIDMIQLIPIGTVIPTDAHTPEEYQYASFVRSHNQGLIDDFNRTDTSHASGLTGSTLECYPWDTNTQPTCGIFLNNAPLQGLPNSAFMSFDAPANSGATLSMRLDPTFAGTDISSARGISFYSRMKTGTARGLLQLNYIGAPDYNVPGYAIPMHIGNAWPDAPDTILFNDPNATCSYEANCNVSPLSILNRVTTIDFSLKTSSVVTNGRFEIDQLRLVF